MCQDLCILEAFDALKRVSFIVPDQNNGHSFSFLYFLEAEKAEGIQTFC